MVRSKGFIRERDINEMFEDKHDTVINADVLQRVKEIKNRNVTQKITERLAGIHLIDDKK